MTVGEDAWAATLDQFAERLQQQRTALTAGQPDQTPEFVPPPGLGPLPPSQVERARKLLAESEAVQAALSAAMARVNRELAALERTTGPTPATPSFIDHRA
jgi:hypothetical protein